MSAVVVFPDIEDALLAYLVTKTELTTLVSQRIWDFPVPDPIYPFLTMRKLSSRTGAPRWLEACTVEVAGWEHRDVANASSKARLVCETGVAVLNALANTTLDGCVIGGPIATVGPRPVPDQQDRGITNPRYIAEVTVTYHPSHA